MQKLVGALGAHWHAPTCAESAKSARAVAGAGITDRAGAGDKLYSELHDELYQFSFASRRWFPLALRARRGAAAQARRHVCGKQSFAKSGDSDAVCSPGTSAHRIWRLGHRAARAPRFGCKPLAARPALGTEAQTGHLATLCPVRLSAFGMGPLVKSLMMLLEC